MPTGTHGSFVWYDLLTPDPQAAAAFYRDVVGWTSQPFPESGVAYTMFVGAQGPLAGTTRPEQAGVRAQWVANVFVEVVDASAALAAKLGGACGRRPRTTRRWGGWRWWAIRRACRSTSSSRAGRWSCTTPPGRVSSSGVSS